MNFFRSFYGVIIALVVSVVLLPLAHAQSPKPTDITPSQPYAIWQNINVALLDYAELKGTPLSVLNEMSSLQPEKHDGKIPADVFNKVDEFGEIFNSYSNNYKTSHGDEMASLEERIIGTFKKESDEIVPSMVFIKSIIVMDSIIQEMIPIKRDDQLYSPYFVLQEFEQKQPSDVFGLVELATRRLELLLASEGSL